jgi:hypothetical protein
LIDALSETRLDYARIQVILLTKILFVLLERRTSALANNNMYSSHDMSYTTIGGTHHSQYPKCDILILAIEEYFINPVIFAYDTEIAN